MSKQYKKLPTGLGKGLGALIPSSAQSNDDFDNNSDEIASDFSFQIDIDRINVNPLQPRKEFDIESLEELRDSILQHGVIQAITVRRVEDGYELISGERRLRASKMAGLVRIPAYIVDIESNAAILEMAIIENIQREDLNPIEIAEGYQRLIEECSLTQDEVAKKVGKNRSTIANFLRLNKLQSTIKEGLISKSLTMGHARALLAVNDSDLQIRAYYEILENELSVRATESLCKFISETGKFPGEQSLKKSKSGESWQPDAEFKATISEIENNIRHIFASDVRIKTKNENSGLMEFHFHTKDEFDRLLEMFYKLSDEAIEN